MVEPECTFEGCERERKVKEWCAAHYAQHARGTELKPIREPNPVIDGTRRCSRCREVKDIGEFYYHVKRGIYFSYCRSCKAEKGREWYAKKNPKKERPVLTECVGPECDRMAAVPRPQMLCLSHYNQQWSGKPLTPLREHRKSYINDEWRMCTSCDVVKATGEFYKRSNGSVKQECKECEKTKNRANYLMRVGRLDDAVRALEGASERTRNRLLPRLVKKLNEREMERSNG